MVDWINSNGVTVTSDYESPESNISPIVPVIGSGALTPVPFTSAFNATMTNPTYDDAAPASFGGYALSGGFGTVEGNFLNQLPFTVRCKVKSGTVAPAGVSVYIGSRLCFWIAIGSDGKFVANVGNGTGIPLGTNIVGLDNNPHDLELVCTAQGATFYVDGALANSYTGAINYDFTSGLGIGYLGGNGSNLGDYAMYGEIGAVQVFNSALHTGNFTPPAAPYPSNTPDMVLSYEFENNGNNSIVNYTSLGLLPAGAKGVRFYLNSGDNITFGINNSTPGANFETFTISGTNTGPNWDEALAGSQTVYLADVEGSPSYRWVW